MPTSVERSKQSAELFHAGPVLAGRVVLPEDAVDSGQEVAVGHLQNRPVPEDPGGDGVSPVIAQVRLGPGDVGDIGRGGHRLPLVVRMPDLALEAAAPDEPAVVVEDQDPARALVGGCIRR